MLRRMLSPNLCPCISVYFEGDSFGVCRKIDVTCPKS